MNKTKLTDGPHKLSGVCNAIFHVGWDGENEVNGYIFVIDGVNYAIYEDPDDGYRSFGCFFETEQKCTNTFPPQDVIIESYDTDWRLDSDGFNEEKESGIKILNPDNRLLILDIGTMWYDEYYPCAVMCYRPENLPINQNISMTYHELGNLISLVGAMITSGDNSFKRGCDILTTDANLSPELVRHIISVVQANRSIINYK